MPDSIRAKSFESDLQKLKSTYGDVIEDKVLFSLEWELGRAKSYSKYHVVSNEDDEEFRYIVSKPIKHEEISIPALMLIFGFEDFHGETKLLFVAIKVTEPDNIDQ